MPIYGYRCGQCGTEVEVFQSMSDAPLKVCTQCGGPLRKLLYPVGVQFKGSGFYTTDYARNGSAAKSEGKAGEEAATSGSGKGGETALKGEEKTADRAAEK